jgi:hypothetical protein
LPYLKILVANVKGTINTASSVECSIDGMSIPIEVTYNTAPYKDVIVSLEKMWYDQADNTTTDPSSGLTPSTTEGSVTLTVLVPSGVLSFKCADTLSVLNTTLKLSYNISGSNRDSF